MSLAGGLRIKDPAVDLAACLAVTIIGIPFAWQHVKLALASLTPVGKAVLEV